MSFARPSAPAASCWRVLFLALWLALLAGCAQLPTLQGRSVSHALRDTDATPLGRAFRPLVRAHPGRSGIVPLPDGLDAFAARIALANAAQRSLDVQSYIWHDDLSGGLLFDALRRAADRGVRVRLLLDDSNTEGLDEVLSALDACPGIEVRLFNPFANRNWRALDALTDFARVNRRMHNKSFTADNQVTVIGGRNIGDEYFEARSGLLFLDLDVLALGPVVHEVSDDFDRYWASDSAYPVRRLLAPAGSTPARAHAQGAPSAETARALRAAVARTGFLDDLEAGRTPIEWARTTLVSDDPGKGLGRAARDGQLTARLQRVLGGPPERELQVVSSYFVPGDRGTTWFDDLARRGVRVRVLTNALEATDVPAVHAGYARWRPALLAAGVELYELKRSAERATRHQRIFRGSSTSSLHAKVFVVDRARVFVGSFNFDPRSAHLNTEIGFVIDSPALAQRMAQQFTERVPLLAYRVRLEAGALQWVEQDAAGTHVYTQEPHAGFWRQLGVSLMSLLPIEDML